MKGIGQSVVRSRTSARNNLMIVFVLAFFFCDDCVSFTDKQRIEFGVDVTCVALSPDSRRVLMGGTGKKRLKILDLAARKERVLLDDASPEIRAVAFDPHGKLAFSGDANGHIRTWDIEKQKQVRDMNLGASVSALAISPNGRTLIGGTAKGQVQSWDIESGEKLGFSKKLPAEVTAIAYSPDGELIGIACRDTTARFCRLDGKEVAVLSHATPVTALAFHNNQVCATGTAEGVARQWNVTTTEPMGKRRKRKQPVAALAFSGKQWMVVNDKRIAIRSLEGKVHGILVHLDKGSAIAAAFLMASPSADASEHLGVFLGSP